MGGGGAVLRDGQHSRDSGFRTKRSNWGGLCGRKHTPRIRGLVRILDPSEPNRALSPGKNTSSRKENAHCLQLERASENTFSASVRSRKVE